MRLAIILDTTGTDAEVYELEDTAEIPSKEHVGTFPLPGAMMAAMLGLPPEADAIDTTARELPPNPRGSAYV